MRKKKKKKKVTSTTSNDQFFFHTSKWFTNFNKLACSKYRRDTKVTRPEGEFSHPTCEIKNKMTRSRYFTSYGSVTRPFKQWWYWHDCAHAWVFLNLYCRWMRKDSFRMDRPIYIYYFPVLWQEGIIPFQISSNECISRERSRAGGGTGKPAYGRAMSRRNLFFSVHDGIFSQKMNLIMHRSLFLKHMSNSKFQLNYLNKKTSVDLALTISQLVANRLLSVTSASMQQHDVVSTLMQRRRHGINLHEQLPKR